jgi:quercetin dioxygenase-like cupin family protein
VKGTLSLKIDNEKKTVRRGDCFYIFYDSKLFLKNLSKKSAEILIVNY